MCVGVGVCMCVSGDTNSTQMRVKALRGDGGKAAVRRGGITPLAGVVYTEKNGVGVTKQASLSGPPIRAGGEAGDLPSHRSEWLV